MKAFTATAFLLTYLTATSGIAEDREEAAKKADSKETAELYEASIHRGPGGHLEANIDLGSLPAGRTVPAMLRLQNSTNASIPIRSMTTTCGCLKVRTLTDEFLPGGFVDCELSVEVPKQAKDLVQRVMFTIYYEDTMGVTVRLNYQISGLATFPSKAFLTNIPLGKRKHIFQIPILISPPTKLDEITVLPDESLGFTEVKPVEVDGKFFLNCSLELGEKEHGRDGIISLVAPDGHTTSLLSCVVAVEQSVSIAPPMLRFVPDVSGEVYTASAIVRIHDSMLVLSRDKAGTERKPSFTLVGTTEDPDYETKALRIARGVYRLKITATAKVAEDPQAWTKASRTARFSTLTGKESIPKEVKLTFRD